MPKPSYRITEKDYRFARAYIRRKLINPDWPGENNYMEARETFETWSGRDPHALHAWCNRYFDFERWHQLKTSIRAARRRQKNRDETTITVSRSVWLLLQEIKEDTAITNNEALKLALNDYLRRSKEQSG